MNRLLLLFSIVMTTWTVSASAGSLLLISIDGLHPAYVTQADRHGLKVPNLRRFVSDGTYASGVVGVVPTVTYPSHTTLLTGVAPAAHGIASNTTFDPLGTNRDGWYWYAEDIKVPTLWEAADRSQLVTAAVNWPVTVGDPHIRYLLPEFWRASTSDDLKLIRALSHPAGLLAGLEAKLGPFVDGNTDTLESDRIRTRFALALLREHKPQFTAVHLVALDGIEHARGPFVADAFSTLEALDAMIGELGAAALANDPATTVAVVSDHGFIGTHTAVNLRTRFVDAGLITLAKSTDPLGPPTIASWRAQLWNGGASAAVVLRQPDDQRTRLKVAGLLTDLKADPANGIARVLPTSALTEAGAFPGAEFLVEFAPGFYLGTALRGGLLTPGTSKGTHGYLPERPEMHASLFVMGSSIARGKNVGVIDMKQIAPTLAAILGVSLPGAGAQAVAISR